MTSLAIFEVTCRACNFFQVFSVSFISPPLKPLKMTSPSYGLCKFWNVCKKYNIKYNNFLVSGEIKNVTKYSDISSKNKYTIKTVNSGLIIESIFFLQMILHTVQIFHLWRITQYRTNTVVGNIDV